MAKDMGWSYIRSTSSTATKSTSAMRSGDKTKHPDSNPWGKKASGSVQSPEGEGAAVKRLHRDVLCCPFNIPSPVFLGSMWRPSHFSLMPSSPFVSSRPPLQPWLPRSRAPSPRPSPCRFRRGCSTPNPGRLQPVAIQPLLFPGFCATRCARVPAAGLSPRLRGNRRGRRRSGLSPRLRGNRHCLARVYPRACGGTGGPHLLSPRLRGTSASRSRRGRYAVYPRACGGTTCCSLAVLAESEPTIPAPAGEPCRRRRRGLPCRVYPRACGGTASVVNVALLFATIPAPAGEPMIW